MSSNPPHYGFYTDLARIINSGQSRSVLLSGNVHDLFFTGEDGYLPIIPFLVEKCRVPGLQLLVYELNGPIRTVAKDGRERLRKGWVAWRSGRPAEDLILKSLTDKKVEREREMLEAEFGRHLEQAIGKPTLALEFLRQLTLCSRTDDSNGRPYLEENLLILIEGADFLLPAGDGDISRLAPQDRHRVSILHDWFSDPGFLTGQDSVILVSESPSLVHPRVSRLPQVISLEVPAPDHANRAHYIAWLSERCEPDARPQLWGTVRELAGFTAGLSIHALRQLLVSSAHHGETLTPPQVVAKVEAFISGQLGEDVVEFKKPEHSLDDVIGFSRLKAFIRDELLVRFRATGGGALPGAAVAGPIGGGKTFIFEAVAAALDLPVLLLKNIRSQWFGQTDVIFERLRRVLEALDKVVIFVDEADTQFGGVGPEAHSTERRLTGKIQQMMSEPKLRGRIIWLLMTARIHLLSPDIRRPGRVGDLIIPVLDPAGDDRREFLRWVLSGVLAEEPAEKDLEQLDNLTEGYSAASFASLRSRLRARAETGRLEVDEVGRILRDQIPPAIQRTRRYQTLQALLNTTRRSLLPDPDIGEKERRAWAEEIQELERQGER